MKLEYYDDNGRSLTPKEVRCMFMLDFHSIPKLMCSLQQRSFVVITSVIFSSVILDIEQS